MAKRANYESRPIYFPSHRGYYETYYHVDGEWSSVYPNAANQSNVIDITVQDQTSATSSWSEPEQGANRGSGCVQNWPEETAYDGYQCTVPTGAGELGPPPPWYDYQSITPGYAVINIGAGAGYSAASHVEQPSVQKQLQSYGLTPNDGVGDDRAVGERVSSPNGRRKKERGHDEGRRRRRRGYTYVRCRRRRRPCSRGSSCRRSRKPEDVVVTGCDDRWGGDRGCDIGANPREDDVRRWVYSYEYGDRRD